MNKLVSYTQQTLTLQVKDATVVVPWDKVQFVSYDEKLQSGVVFVADHQVVLDYREAKWVADLLQLVLKGHPVEDVDFDDE